MFLYGLLEEQLLHQGSKEWGSNVKQTNKRNDNHDNKWQKNNKSSRKKWRTGFGRTVQVQRSKFLDKVKGQLVIPFYSICLQLKKTKKCNRLPTAVGS